MAALSRRQLLGAAGAAAGGLAVGAGARAAVESGSDERQVEPFYGARQGGIITAAQDRLHIAAFDLVEGTTRAELAELMRTWTDAAARMTEGQPVGGAEPPLAPPSDTGEAAGLSPARLTVTFGFGPSLFARGRLGLEGRRPQALAELPPLPRDELDPDRSGGDLCVQACADDPQVAFHAVRNLARLGRGLVVMRWSQLGFGRTSKTTADQQTPRNLMGFKDGTNNLTAEDEGALHRHVWAGAEAPAWLRGGTYLVARRIRMLIEVWDRASLVEQERTLGRHKASGAPLGGRREHDPLDLRGGAIPVDAHVRLAAPATNGGVRILRRGYSFTDGFDPELGQLDAGLFFIAFVRDPAQFVALQRRLGLHDALNEYIKHVASAVFAVPPGARRGGYVGQALLGR